MVQRLLALLTVLGLTSGFGVMVSYAHEALPPEELAGVRPCVQTSSVQLGLEDVPVGVMRGVDTEGVRRDLYSYLISTLERLKIPYGDLCPNSPNFLLFGLYARFLDPQSYVGFPDASYTYLTTGQLGTFAPQPTLDTALVPLLYGTSFSEIVQAPTSRALSEQLVSLGQSQIHDFLRHWLEANRVPRLLYVLFGTLGVALVALRLLPQLIR